MQKVFTFGKANGKPCKFQLFIGCNSYIRLYVNDELVLQTPKKNNVYVYDADTTFTTAKIPKTSTIKIEIVRSKSKKNGNSSKDKLILSSMGEIRSFLEHPLRTGAKINGGTNRIETISFWQDEYE